MAILKKSPTYQKIEDKLGIGLQEEADVHTKVGEFLFNEQLPPRKEPVTPVVHQPDLLGGVFNTPPSRIGEVIGQKYPDVTPERIQEEQIRQPGAHLAGQMFREPVKLAADALSQIFRVSNLVGDKAIPGLMATIKGNIGKIADEATALIREFEYKTIPFSRKGEPYRILTEKQITEGAFKSKPKPVNIKNVGDRVWYHGTRQQVDKYVHDVGAPGGTIKAPTLADLDTAAGRERLDTGFIGNGLYMTDEIGFGAYFALVRDIERGVPRFVYSGVPKANLKVLDLTQPLKGNTEMMDTFLSATRFSRIQYTGLKKDFLTERVFNDFGQDPRRKTKTLEDFYRFLKKRERSLDNKQIADEIPNIQPGVFMAKLPELLKKQGFKGMHHKEGGHNVLLLWVEEGGTVGENIAVAGKQLGVMRPTSIHEQNFSRKFIQDKDFSKNFGAYVRDPRNGLEDKFYRFMNPKKTVKTLSDYHPSHGLGTIGKEVLGSNPARTLGNFKRMLIAEELHYRYPKVAPETKDKIRLIDKILGKNSSTEKAGLMSRLHKKDVFRRDEWSIIGEHD